MKVARRNYLVNKPYQFGLLVLFILIIFIAIFISVVVTHFCLLSSIVSKLDETGIPPTGMDLIRASLKPFAIIVPVVFIILVLAFIYIIFISHRTAGPLYHLKKAMERVGQGDLSVSIQFRNNDEIHDVAESFNKMVQGLKQKFGDKQK